MASSSSIRSSVRRAAPFIPLICCPDCGQEVKQSRSGTPQHEGWIYYSCKKHMRGCDFWHWELSYVMYIVEKGYLPGPLGDEAFAWAEERREKLELKKKEKEAAAGRTSEQDERMMKSMSSLGEQLTEALLLLKLVVLLMVVGCVLLLQNK